MISAHALLVPAALLAGLAILAPGGEAQPNLIPEDPNAILLNVKEFGEPIPPVTGFATVEVTVTYKCEAFWTGASIAGGESANLSFTLIPKQPFVLAVLDRYQDIPIRATPQNCPPQETRTLQNNLSVTFTREAPAFTPIHILELTATTRTNAGHNITKSANVTAEAGYYGAISAIAKNKVATAAPRGVAQWSIEVRNNGNTHSMFMTTVEGVPEAWGSAPEFNYPFLDPGDKGTITVNLTLPEKIEGARDGDKVNINYTVFAHDRSKPMFRTDDKTVKLTLILDLGDEKEKDSPVGAAWASAAALLAVAAASRRPRGPRA